MHRHLCCLAVLLAILASAGPALSEDAQRKDALFPKHEIGIGFTVESLDWVVGHAPNNNFYVNGILSGPKIQYQHYTDSRWMFALAGTFLSGRTDWWQDGLGWYKEDRHADTYQQTYDVVAQLGYGFEFPLFGARSSFTPLVGLNYVRRDDGIAIDNQRENDVLRELMLQVGFKFTALLNEQWKVGLDATYGLRYDVVAVSLFSNPTTSIKWERHGRNEGYVVRVSPFVEYHAGGYAFGFAPYLRSSFQPLITNKDKVTNLEENINRFGTDLYLKF